MKKEQQGWLFNLIILTNQQYTNYKVYCDAVIGAANAFKILDSKKWERNHAEIFIQVST